MAPPKLRVEYQALTRMSTTLSELCHDINNYYQHLKNHTEHLHNSGWRGRAADQWFHEMENVLFPKTKHLIQTLESTSQMLKRISDVYRAAERDAAGVFKRTP